MNRLNRMIYLIRKCGLKVAYNKMYFYLFWAWIREHKTILNMYLKNPPYPRYIEIEVTTRCNLKCIMCEHTYWDEPNRDMSLDEFKHIIDQFPDLVWIGLTGIGESFINKQFMNMLEYVKSKDITVELYDTFYFIDKYTSKRLIAMGVDKILVSLDGATKDTYEKIRIGSDFDKVISNVRTLFEQKSLHNSDFPEVSFHFIIMKHNINEVLPYIDLVYSIAGSESPIQFSQFLHNYKDVNNLYIEVSEELISMVELRAKSLGIKIIWSLDVPKIKPMMSECIEWNMPFIFVNGDVIPCCASNESGNRENQKKLKLGNVFETLFKEIWNNKLYQELRNGLLNEQVPKQCINCCIYDRCDSK